MGAKSTRAMMACASCGQTLSDAFEGGDVLDANNFQWLHVWHAIPKHLIPDESARDKIAQRVAEKVSEIALPTLAELQEED